jgi:carboxyl-terminal processing protease
MRRSLTLNAAFVTAAAMLALILTVVRSSPEGVMSFQLATREVRAAPGAAQVITHDLTALEVFNFTLLRIKDRYVDPTRIDPNKMFYQALDMVQFRIPEVLVEPDPASKQVTVAVNDKREVFSTADVTSLWRLAAGLKRVFRFVRGQHELRRRPGAGRVRRRQRHAGHARSAL